MQRSTAMLMLLLSVGGSGAIISAEESGVITNSIGMKLKQIPAGTFTMGFSRGFYNRPREVTLTKPFELGLYEVTQQQYERVMGTNPSFFKGEQKPVERVSWDDAISFCRKLSELPAEKAAGRVYRLPTGAEWEYACRAGTTSAFSFGHNVSEIGDFAWYEVNSSKSTHPVGEKKPNAWGIHDMHGNVEEWTQDWAGGYAPIDPVTDPTGPAEPFNGWIARVGRGGSAFDPAEECNSFCETYIRPSDRFYKLGFRVVAVPLHPKP